jgi:pyruvate/2-oxoglutarate dehydrogenase complex dihydrolipoamide dehydrogenase (E3) component
MYDLIVIGGGPAGVTAALRASELGVKVALVERDRLGGTCTNDGCVPTRVLARAARLARDAAQLNEYGMESQTPGVDIERLMARAQQVVYQIHEKKQLVHHLKESGVETYLSVGSASFLDAHTLRLGDGRHLHGERFVLCTGGHARRLNFPGAEYALTHSDVWQMKQLPRSLAIVGAAATGCQLASIFNAFGCQVHLLEVAPRILQLEDRDVSIALQQAFLQRGIQIVTGIGGVERIEKQGDDYNLWYILDGESRCLRVEAVILAVGWPGNIEGLNLEAAGVQVERNFVVVDDTLRTTAGHIYAAGDVTGRVGLVQSANSEAHTAVENALMNTGQCLARQDRKIVPHGGFTDPEYGSVGLSEEKANVEGDAISAIVPYNVMDRAVIDGRTNGLGKLIVSRSTHHILGAHVVGEQALEVVQLIAAGMSVGMRVDQLADLEIAYPTYTAIVGLAARRIVNQLGLRHLSPQWRALDRPHVAEWEQNVGG